ncbi:MAG: cytochrome c biogenesis protein CcsA [Bacillota bacterium]
MIGNIGILIAFGSALAAAILFLKKAISSQSGKSAGIDYAYVFYHLHTAGIIIASVYLMYVLLTHQFQYYYVFAHTNLELPLKYLVSSFWAGQEGTFLLWALMAALAGYLLMKKEKELLPAVMPFILLGQLFLMIFLFLETPFYDLGRVPADGMGMNPLLMDPWMVIHPPIVFIGYALLTIPFAYAVAALWKKDWSVGFLRALPWAGAGWLFLGAGIFIGAAWAYRVLGWGGYWGWDPVENASLVPWLTATALVHGLVGQKQKGRFVKSNLLLAIITFVLIITATFLTRGGVMADYSVHAFAETALTYVLGIFVLIYLVPGLALYIARFKFLPVQSSSEGFFSRQGSFVITMVVLCLSALLVLLGTLSPILTGLFGSPASVDEQFYFQTNSPLFFLLFIVLIVCPLLGWKNEVFKVVFTRLKKILIIFPAALIVAYLAGVNSFFNLLFIGIMTLALAVNVVWLVRTVKAGLKFSGAYLAHVGLALLFIGVLASTFYTESQLLNLKKGEPVEALGLEFTYLGLTVEGENNYPVVQVEDGTRVIIARPNIYTAGEQVMRSPAIQHNILSDLYISPMELQIVGGGETFVLAKDEQYRVGDYLIVFRDFSFASHSEAEVIEVGALLDVDGGDGFREYMPTIVQNPAERINNPAILPGGERIIMEKIDADNGMVQLTFEGGESVVEEEIFIAEVKIKPLISILAIGAVLLVAGTAIAVWRRFTT